MSSPLPVPSKAALRALRGLVLGTSCTLALITEDRRRRIDHALKILENGEKVKAARNYHAGGGERLLAASTDDFVEFCESLQHRSHLKSRLRAPKQRDHTTVGVHENAELEPEPEQSPANVLLTDPSQSQESAATAPPGLSEVLAASKPRVEDASWANSKRKRWTPWGAKAKAKAVDKFREYSFADSGIAVKYKPLSRRYPTIEQYAFPTNDKIVAMVQKACYSENPSEITGAVQHVLSAYKAGVAPSNGDEKWATACALLCRTSQKLGQLEDATNLLTQVLKTKISEETYFAFDPYPLIDSLLKQISHQDRESSLQILDTCVAMFLPKWAEETQIKDQRIFDVGKALMETEFKLDRLLHPVNLSIRCYKVADHSNHLGNFTEWIIDNLHQRGGYKQAIRLFYSKYVDMAPETISINKVCGVVVECVETAHNYRAEDVLRGMIRLAESSGKRLRFEWVMRLLTSYWRRTKSFEAVEGLFNELATVGFRKLMLDHPHAVCRVMVEIALEAGGDDPWAKVDHYIAQGTLLDPNFANDPSVRGAIAVFDAKIGNWEAVKEYFIKTDANMANLMNEVSIARANKARSASFVPILKIYAASHTIRETETFLKFYIDELNVPLSAYMVPLIAKHYTALHDFSSLSKWLLYCASTLLGNNKTTQPPPEFATAILSACRKANMPFHSLRALFYSLRDINPNLVDRVSEKIMLNSALSISSTGGRIARSRISSLGLDKRAHACENNARKRRCDSEGEVGLTMKELITVGRPGEALLVYKRALHLGMPGGELCLRLAVLALLQFGKFGWSGKRCFDRAWGLVGQARGRGLEVDEVANLLLAKQLGRVLRPQDSSEGGTTTTTGNGEAVFWLIRDVLVRTERRGIMIHERTLNQAGLTCLGQGGQGQGQAKAALLFAEAAAERHGEGRCYDSLNFRLFLFAYAELSDARGLRECIELARERAYWVKEKTCREALRVARLRIGLAKGVDVTPARKLYCDRVVKEALGALVEERRKFAERRDEFADFALGLMKDAAAAASGQQVPAPTSAAQEQLGAASPWIVGEDREEEEKDWLLEALQGPGGAVGADWQTSPVVASPHKPPLVNKKVFSETWDNSSIKTPDDGLKDTAGVVSHERRLGKPVVRMFFGPQVEAHGG